MKKVFYLVSVLLMFGLRAEAQVTNLTVNGSALNFSLASGDNLSWAFDIPTGGTAFCTIWLDVNANGTIDPGVDQVYLSFSQTDGDTVGGDGPPDMDGQANGHVTFGQPLGLAPGNFIVNFTNNSAGMSVAGLITPLASPVHTLSGHVTVPAGRSARYLTIEASRGNNHSPSFWHGITDASGNYAIQMNADTSGNPWRVRIQENPYPPAIVSPEETPVTVTGNHSGSDFSLLAASAQVAGYVKDENGVPMRGRDVAISRNDGLVWRDARANSLGFYQAGALSGELSGQTWRIQTNNENGGQFTTNELLGQRNLGVLHSGDSLYVPLVIYLVNAQIQGQFRVNGFAPGFPIMVMASNTDTAESIVSSDGATGNFTIGVSTRIYNYTLSPMDLPPNYSVQPVLAHPGETGIVMDITMTSVDDRSGKPGEFSLGQNFPNPFNPSTIIRYELGGNTHVTLTVLNVLGQEVVRLVDGEQVAGSHEVKLEPRGLSSGVYFYRLVAGSFTSTKKLMLLK